MYRTISLMILVSTGMLLAAPTTLTDKQKKELLHKQFLRKKGFSDRGIDRLHDSIAYSLNQIKVFVVDKKFYEKSRKYNADLPADAYTNLNDKAIADKPADSHASYMADDKNLLSFKTDIFLKDKEGKNYISIDLGQGVSLNEHPNAHYTYETKAYIYPADDYKTLSKVILQFKRVNATGSTSTGADLRHVREMRRVINNTPAAPGPPKRDGDQVDLLPKMQQERFVNASHKGDSNADIELELYSVVDKTPKWPDLPVIDAKPVIKTKLHSKDDLLDYAIQKELITNYKKAMIDTDLYLKKLYRIMELNKRSTNRKMLLGN
ncbi:MAG: hypothetical protein AAF518_01245 [Spirochaetota bacterium]